LLHKIIGISVETSETKLINAQKIRANITLFLG